MFETKILALSITSNLDIYSRSCWAYLEAERTRSRSVWRTSGAVLGAEPAFNRIGTYFGNMMVLYSIKCVFNFAKDVRDNIHLDLSSKVRFYSVLMLFQCSWGCMFLSLSWEWMWIILKGSTSVSRVRFPQPTWKGHTFWGERAQDLPPRKKVALA